MTDSISDAAKLARDSLFDRPELNTPEAISNGPLSVDQITARDIAGGLAELAALQPPQAYKTGGGTWKLTPAGVEAAG